MDVYSARPVAAPADPHQIHPPAHHHKYNKPSQHIHQQQTHHHHQPGSLLVPIVPTVATSYPGEDASCFLMRTMFTDSMDAQPGENNPKKASCPQCGKWVSKRKMSQHIRTHTHEKPHKCERCDRAFSRIEHLQRHRMIHTGEKPYSCSVCEKRFGRNDHLRTHMRIHTGEKPHKCGECGKEFMRSDHKLKHMNSHARKIVT